MPRGFGPVPGAARRVEFSAADELPAEPRIPGAHNRENAAAATAVARALDLDERAIAAALREFAGVPHRLEQVRELGGVRFVNDSKATNVAAALRGLAAYPDPLHLILGGSLKGESFAPLARAIRERGGVRSVQLVGQATEELARRARHRRRSRTRTRGRSSAPSPGLRQPPPRARSSCSRRPAPATTSSRTSRSEATSSAAWWRTL